MNYFYTFLPNKQLLTLGIVLGALTFTACSTEHVAQRQKSKLAPSERAWDEKYEKITGTVIVPSKSLKLYQCIDAWMGVPYRYGGCTKKGVDCSGFAANVYQEVYQKKLPRVVDDQYKMASKVGKSRLKEGDLVFFKIEGKKISHVGIYLANHKFIHASSSPKGVIIEDLGIDYYEKRFKKGGRI